MDVDVAFGNDREDLGTLTDVPQPRPRTIKQFLQTTGMLHKDFARKIGVRPSHLSMYLRNERNFSVKVLKKASQITGIPESDLIHASDRRRRRRSA